MKMQRIKKLLSYYKPYKKDLFLDLLCSVINSVAVTILPVLVRYLTDDVVHFEREEAFRALAFVALGALGIFFIIFLCQRYIEYKGNMLATKVEVDIKTELFEHFQKQDFNFFDEQKVGKLMTYITTDAYNLSTFTKEIPETLLDLLIRLSGAGIVLFFASPVFGGITFGILALILLLALRYIPKMQKEIENERLIYADLTSNLEESLSGIKTVQSFTNEGKEISKFKDNMKVYLLTNDRQNKIQGTLMAAIDPILIGLIPITTIIAMFFILRGDFFMNDLLIFMLYADILIAPIFNMFSLIAGFNDGVIGFKRIFDILSVDTEIKNEKDAVKLDKVSGSIKFNDVSFTYKSGRKIFEHLNLDIKAGEYVALVGSSGAGKSTLCNLIPRFYDINSGEILVDDIPVKKIDLESLRKNIGFVRQDVVLFSGTIADNIAYGKLNATREEIIAAAKNAHAHEFILNLEKGYDTYIGERGASLSGGQRQRIAIARAFLKNSPILIFDEATSSLDNESEKFIQKSMEDLAQNRTTIVIAHRLSTIRNAKRILVLSGGKIAEEGTHEELLNKNGIYADLYNMQFSKNNSAN